MGSTLFTVAITLGDPAGIGPEVVLKALSDPAIASLAQWLVVGDSAPIEQAQSATGLQSSALRNYRLMDSKRIDVSQFALGKLSPECGRAALEYIRVATRLCMDGEAQAMVTAPVNKEAITMSGEHFTGHTEFIATLCGARDSRMLLVNDRLRVVHVSTHIALRQACDLQPERVRRTIELGFAAMRLLGFARPRIAVCGLNPHAGEHGLFGDEDSNFILPAIQAARSEGIACEGPLPADTIFFKALRGDYDLVVAMYHDQGHIPMKLLDFEHTVNVSLGLPIIRTSVDHGTAFDIAGKNLADPTSMKSALKLAAQMAAHRRDTVSLDASRRAR